MNDNRRKRIAEIVARLESTYEDLTAIRDEEQEAYDNLPESFQSGEKGEKSQEAIDALDSACDGLESLKDELGDIGQ